METTILQWGIYWGYIECDICCENKHKDDDARWPFAPGGEPRGQAQFINVVIRRLALLCFLFFSFSYSYYHEL